MTNPNSKSITFAISKPSQHVQQQSCTASKTHQQIIHLDSVIDSGSNSANVARSPHHGQQTKPRRRSANANGYADVSMMKMRRTSNWIWDTIESGCWPNFGQLSRRSCARISRRSCASGRGGCSPKFGQAARWNDDASPADPRRAAQPAQDGDGLVLHGEQHADRRHDSGGSDGCHGERHVCSGGAEAVAILAEGHQPCGVLEF
jgi:hypothetical protein